MNNQNVVWRDPETGEMGQSSRVVWSGKTLTVVECEDDTDGADGADATYDTDATGDTEATGDTGKWILSRMFVTPDTNVLLTFYRIMSSMFSKF